MTMTDKNIVKDYITTITILEHITDSIFILDGAANIQYANKAAIEMLKSSMEELKNKNITQFLCFPNEYSPYSNDDRFFNLIENIDRGIFNEVEMTLVNNDIAIPVVVSFGLVRNARNNIQFMIVSAKDISIRKQLEKEIEQKREMSVSQNKIKSLGDMAVSLVHQLSQPLATIKLQVDLTQKKLDNPKNTKKKIRENLEQISILLDSMSESVNNVRNFAFKVDDSSLRRVNLKESIQNAANQIAYELQERGISIEVEAEKSLPFVSAVPINIEQVFVMLIKYFWHIRDNNHPNRSVTNLYFTLSSVGNKWIKIMISDNKELPHKDYVLREINWLTEITQMIFFMKVELSTIKAIIESMGGDIKVKKDNVGNTCFILRVPADEKTERDQLINLIELLHHEN